VTSGREGLGDQPLKPYWKENNMTSSMSKATAAVTSAPDAPAPDAPAPDAPDAIDNPWFRAAEFADRIEMNDPHAAVQ
jgi:hypothetical protein